MHLFRTRTGITFLATLFLGLMLAGCQSVNNQQDNTPKVQHIKGVVVAVDKKNQLLDVHHEAIPGKMDAMTMAFSLDDPAQLSKLHKGDHITADMSVVARGAVLSNIVVIDKKKSTSKQQKPPKK